MLDRTTTSVLMAALVATTGCMGLFGDGDEELEAQATQSASLVLAAENATEEPRHLGLTIREVFVHNASVPAPEGYFALEVATDHADLVADGEADELRVANGTLPPGTYDQVVLRLGPTEVETGASGASTGEEDGHGDHDHDHGDEENSSDQHDESNETNASNASNASNTSNDTEAERSRSQDGAQGGFDVPVNVTFEVTQDASTSLRLVLDAGASTEDGSFEPVLQRVDVAKDGEVVEEIDDPEVAFREAGQDAPTDTDPPAARATVYGPGGDKVHSPAFVAEDDVFANTPSEPFRMNETVRFSGAESEAVADGAVLESYHWDFGDNQTAEQMNVEHAYQTPGVYEVTLTVRDSLGVEDQHTVRVVVANWTELGIDTSFEEGQGNWTVDTSCCTGLTSWELDGDGYESETSWHAGTHGIVNDAMGAGPAATTTLISPNVTIPEDWTVAGFDFQTRGALDGAGFCPHTVQITYDVFGNQSGEASTQDVESFSETHGEWTKVGGLGAFAEADTDVAGKTVRFSFQFSSGCIYQYTQGEGWFVDDFSIGGVPEDDFSNAHLLEEGGHGGHDHEH